MTAGTRRIVVVEDDEDIRVLVSVVLSKAGLLAEGYRSCESALAAAIGPDAELYLLDVRMPGMTGLELCRVLRADPATRATPIVLMSAETSEHDVAAALAAGADDYLSKPFTTRQLLHKVKALLKS